MSLMSAAGPWLYPLVAVGLCLLAAIGRSAFLISSSGERALGGGPPHHTVIVWGVLGGVVGLLGTVIGFGRVAVGAGAVAGAERAELEQMLALMWDGAMVIVTPVTLGLWLFTVSLVAWLGLAYFWGRRFR